MEMKPIPKRRRTRSGQALIEFALILPLLFLLIVNVVNFGGFFYAWITVSNAARAGAQYMVMSDTWISGLTPPSASQVSTLVTTDLLSLPNRASAQVKVCINISGTTACNPSGGSGPPNDPESSFYNSTSVDVTYTYQPFVSFWDFSRLGIHLTLPATTIHRRVVMRCAGGCTVS
jgi:hypothetical protein